MYLSEIIERSFEKEIAIHCDTPEKANILFALLKKSYVRWHITSDIVESTHTLWYVNKNATCYILKDGKLSFTTVEYCIQCNYEIIGLNDIKDFSILKKEDTRLTKKFNNMLIICKEKKYVLLKRDNYEVKLQCHEEDKFDWRIGFGLALSQVFGKKPKWKEHREYYRNNKKRKLNYKEYALWCINEFYHNDMFDINNLECRIKKINENGKVDL